PGGHRGTSRRQGRDHHRVGSRHRARHRAAARGGGCRDRCERPRPRTCTRTVAEIEKNGGRAISVAANIMEAAEAKKVVDAAVAEYGKLDILINNAGTTRDNMFHNMGPDVFEFGVKVNRFTAYNMTYVAIPYMREVAKKEKTEQGQPAYNRKIVFTSSVAAITGNPGQANYTAAKGGLIALTKTLARELGPFW